MFGKKRRIGKYKFSYGQSPTLTKIKNRYNGKIPRKEHPLIRKLKGIFTFIIVTALIVLAIYTIFFSNYFRIKNINILKQTFDNETLAKEITNTLETFIGKNIIFTETNEIEAKIISYFPELEEINVNKNYPNTLEIEFKEYPLVANIINTSSTIKKSYIINSIGYAIKENYEDPNLPNIKIDSDEPISTQSPVLEPNKLTYILDSIKYFEEKFGMAIKEIHYKPIAREIHLLTEKDFFIWLDIQRPFEEQLKKLKKSLVKLDIYTEPLEYIDLRIAGTNGHKLIYKRK